MANKIPTARTQAASALVQAAACSLEGGRQVWRQGRAIARRPPRAGKYGPCVLLKMAAGSPCDLVINRSSFKWKRSSHDGSWFGGFAWSFGMWLTLGAMARGRYAVNSIRGDWVVDDGGMTKVLLWAILSVSPLRSGIWQKWKPLGHSHFPCLLGCDVLFPYMGSLSSLSVVRTSWRLLPS